MEPTVAFISGSGLPDWIWDPVREQLDAASLVVPRAISARASLADHIAAGADAIGDAPSVLVAHSVGGLIASGLLAVLDGLVVGIVGICAPIPAGRSFVSSMPFPQRVILPLVLRIAGTRPPASVIRKGVASGLDSATADRIVDDFRAESPGLFLDASDRGPLPDHRGYILTTRDRDLPIGIQEQGAAALNCKPVRVDTGHLPMLEDVDSVVLELRRVVSASLQM